MHWKELLEHLKENVEYIENVNEFCFSSAEILQVFFSLGDCHYSIKYNSKKSTLYISVNVDVLMEIQLTPREASEFTILYEDIKEAYNEYHLGKINNFIKTKKEGPKSIDELNDEE